ncbi:MAG: helix-turn-helix transcriptional regulator [Clostridia bacterium]|nr:helix-turn-helix transcriptional regulator [Clostridia bacterium]
MLKETTIIKKIKKLCARELLTWAKFGRATGFGERYIFELERGERELTMEEFLKICDFFYLTPQEFFSDYVPNVSATCKKIIQRVKVLPHDELILVRDFLDDLQE